MASSIESKSDSPELADLPAPILAVLERVIRRRRNVILLRGITAVTAVAIVTVLSLMALDAAVTIVSSSFRWLLSGGALLLVLAAAAWFLVRPLARRMTLVRIAQLVDAHHPEFEERVSSTVELLANRNRSGNFSSASPALLGELTRQAVDRVCAVEPQREFNLRTVRPYVAAAAGALAILGAIWLIWPQQTGQLLSRAVMPYANVASIQADTLKVTPGTKTVPLGDPLQIKVESSDPRAGGAVLMQSSGGKEISFEMPRVAQESPTTPKGSTGAAPAPLRNAFVVTLPRVVEPFRYRVLVDGRVLSEYFDISVTPKPSVARLELQYEFPAYTGFRPRTDSPSEGDILAPVGSRVTVRASCNKSLTEAKLILDNKAIEAKVLEDHDKPTVVGQIDVTSEIAGRWCLAIKDRFGIEARSADHKIEAVSDAPPAVVIAEPQSAELRLQPTDRMMISYRVREDYGISQAAIMVRTAPAKETTVPIAAPRRSTIERGTWVGQTVLDLGALKPSVPKIEVFVEIRDNRPTEFGGPQVGRSKALTVIFDANAQSYANQSAEAAVRRLSTALGEALNLLKAAKAQVTPARANLEKQPVRLPPETARWIETARSQTSQAEEKLWQLAKQDIDPDLAKIVTAAGKIAEQNVGPARQALELVPLAQNKKEQVDQTKLADEQIDAAIAALTKLMATLGAEQERIARARELAAKLAQMADKQFAIRKATEKAMEGDKGTDAGKEVLQRVLEAQRQIARDAQAMMNQVGREGLGNSDKAPMAAQAETHARQAANELLDNKMPVATAEAKQAAKDFAKLADAVKQMPGYAPPKNSPLPGIDEGAAKLAKREENVVEQLEALAKGDLAKALASLQKDLAEQTKDLANKAKQLEDQAKDQQANNESPKEATPPEEHAQGGNPQKGKDAKGASDDVGQAAEDAMKAATDLGHIDNIPKISPPKFVEGPQSPSDSGGSPDGGQGTQGGGSNTGAGSSKSPSPSNNNINNTIAKGKNLGKATLTAEALLNQKPNNKPMASGGSGTELQADAEELLRKGLAVLMADNNPLAKGFGGYGGGAPDTPVPPTPPHEFSAQGANDQPGGPPQSGAPQDSQAQGSQAQGGQPGGAQPVGRGGKMSAGQGRVASRLGALGISGEDWLKLPSELRDEVLNASDDRAPREYRELVRQYFQTMARRSGQ